MSANKSSVGRFFRALITALRMTMRGEKIPSADERAVSRYPQLSAWTQKTITLLDQVRTASHGFDLTMLHISVDKRATKASTILDTIRYHAAQEYPFLLRQDNAHTVLGIFATNLNDQHYVRALQNIENMPSNVQSVLAELAIHLQNVPQEHPREVHKA